MMNEHEQMNPPWLQFPEIGLGSLGWRMGRGEDYWYAWQDWYIALNNEERSHYQEVFPEPLGWEGFYDRTVMHYQLRVK